MGLIYDMHPVFDAMPQMRPAKDEKSHSCQFSDLGVSVTTRQAKSSTDLKKCLA